MLRNDPSKVMMRYFVMPKNVTLMARHGWRGAGQREEQVLSEALSVLASAGGTAMVGAMATDAWHTARTRFVRLLGQGEQALERVESERLDRAAADTIHLPDEDRGAALQSLQRRWTSQLELLLEEHPAAADELRSLVEELAARQPQPQQTWVQNNVAHAGGVQNITQRGDINVGWGSRASQ